MVVLKLLQTITERCNKGYCRDKRSLQNTCTGNLECWLRVLPVLISVTFAFEDKPFVQLNVNV